MTTGNWPPVGVVDTCLEPLIFTVSCFAGSWLIHLRHRGEQAWRGKDEIARWKHNRLSLPQYGDLDRECARSERISGGDFNAVRNALRWFRFEQAALQNKHSPL